MYADLTFQFGLVLNGADDYSTDGAIVKLSLANVRVDGSRPGGVAVRFASGLGFDNRSSERQRVLEEESESANHRALRAFGQQHGQFGLFRETLVETGQERSAAGQNHPAVVDI